MKLPRMLGGSGSAMRGLHHTPLGASHTPAPRVYIRKMRISPENILREIRWRLNNTAERFIDLAHMYQVELTTVQRLADEDPAYAHITPKEPLR